MSGTTICANQEGTWYDCSRVCFFAAAAQPPDHETSDLGRWSTARVGALWRSLGCMLCAYWSIVATARAIRNVGDFERALVDTVRGILAWGGGMVASHQASPPASSDSALVIPRNFLVRRGSSHAALRGEDLVRKNETWQKMARVLITRPSATTPPRSEGSASNALNH